MLVGNKLDKEDEREVEYLEGLRWAEENSTFDIRCFLGRRHIDDFPALQTSSSSKPRLSPESTPLNPSFSPLNPYSSTSNQANSIRMFLELVYLTANVNFAPSAQVHD